MMEKHKVSIIIPTYKPGEYLYECLDSIYKQTVSKQCIELIVVLNGVVNGYKDAIQSYLDGKEGMEIKTNFLFTETPGVSNARNMGLDEADGDYVAFVDDDDWVSPNYIANLLEASSGDADIVEANVKGYDESSACYVDDYLSVAFETNKRKIRPTLLSARSFLSSSCCKLIRRSVIGGRRFDCRYRIGEDSLFMTLISNGIDKIRLATSDTVYYRRIRKESASRKKTSAKVYAAGQLRLVGEYLKIYIKGFPRYNTPFLATRIIAAIRNIVDYVRK
uniref:glycosyltransferase family 2 protein n=1 Tax=Prevotella sp. TaxID=59823 RepID=UPI00402A20E1